MMEKVLISGAGIAGLTLAYWLRRNRYEVTVVESAPGLKKGGAAVDVRGNALEVASRMNILYRIKAKKISTSIEFVDAQSDTLASVKDFGADALNNDIELNRDDLVGILYEAVGEGVEYLFGNKINGLTLRDDKVSVSFANGLQREFDYVFGADGVHSNVRRLVFGEESKFNHFFGAYFAILKSDRLLEKFNRGMLFNLPGKLAATSDSGNSFVLFRSDRLDYQYNNDAAHRKILLETFAGAGWKVPGILAAMVASENLYFDEVCQIRMPSWTKGRVALVGDAAHCSGFPTGMGTSLAMIGATLLADELAKGDHVTAFLNYNDVFHPTVEEVQAMINAGIDFLVPETAEQIKLRNEMFSKA